MLALITHSTQKRTRMWRCCWCLLLLVVVVHRHHPSVVVSGFLVPTQHGGTSRWRVHSTTSATTTTTTTKINSNSNNNNNEWTGDFDGYIGGDDFADTRSSGTSSSSSGGAASAANKEDDGFSLSKLLFQSSSDLTACQTRQFSLGRDLVISDFIGKLGFEEVTDWEYYYPSEDPTSDERKVVQPNPFDSNQPRRTRQASGSLVRVFRGEFVGTLGGLLRSQALDNRLLVKEFSGGRMAQQLARSELETISKLQSQLFVEKKGGSEDGESWIPVAASRSNDDENIDMGRFRKDSNNVVELLKLLQDAPYVGILGQVNLDEADFNPQEFYRALSVPPPPKDSVWIVYSYAGLSSLQAYCESPPEIRRSKIPPKRGFFGAVEPPPLPSFNDRAAYVKAIIRGIIESVATLHESAQVVHRSIGRSSVILSTTASDKREASSPYATSASQLRVKLSDFGFAGRYGDSCRDEEFCARARAFGLTNIAKGGGGTVATANFAMAEDMHAVGFVVLGLLLTSLAELPSPDYRMPDTDEDTLQRLLGDIFDKDIKQFREYIEAEDVVWSNLVDLLDGNGGAGWKVLETLLLAREKAAEMKDSLQLFSIRKLLSNPFFS